MNLISLLFCIFNSFCQSAKGHIVFLISFRMLSFYSIGLIKDSMNFCSDSVMPYLHNIILQFPTSNSFQKDLTLLSIYFHTALLNDKYHICKCSVFFCIIGKMRNK